MAYHKEGIFRPKWGSLAKIGCPFLVFDPATAQLFDPIPGSGEGMGSMSSIESGYTMPLGRCTEKGEKSHFLEDSITGSFSKGKSGKRISIRSAPITWRRLVNSRS